MTKKLVTVSLFIFAAFVVTVAIAAIINYVGMGAYNRQNSKCQFPAYHCIKAR